jgi:8-oxo-dGTP diphosphatase
MTVVEFYNPGFEPDIRLTYSVIAAKYIDRWIFVRHHNRKTWEIPGGHIEQNETPFQAGSRELTEETGALEFNLECVATYSVLKNGETGFGRLYFAEVYRLGPVPDTSEIAEISMLKSLPDNLTHPDIQPVLFEKIKEFLES